MPASYLAGSAGSPAESLLELGSEATPSVPGEVTEGSWEAVVCALTDTGGRVAVLLVSNVSTVLLIPVCFPLC